jgi:hypothetical protein
MFNCVRLLARLRRGREENSLRRKERVKRKRTEEEEEEGTQSIVTGQLALLDETIRLVLCRPESAGKQLVD